jgi:hypothetical protein
MVYAGARAVPSMACHSDRFAARTIWPPLRSRQRRAKVDSLATDPIGRPLLVWRPLC